MDCGVVARSWFVEPLVPAFGSGSRRSHSVCGCRGRSVARTIVTSEVWSRE